MTDDGQTRIERLLGRFVGLSGGERVLVSVAAVGVAVVVGMLVILAAGYGASCGTPKFSLLGVSFCYDPVSVFTVLFQGAFGNVFNIALTLQQMTLLLFTGLSFAIAFRAGLFNIGAQGQFVLGSLATTVTILWVAPLVPDGTVGSLVLMPLGLVAGVVVGGLYGWLPGVLKARFDTNEVISTLLLNFIATAVAYVLVERFFNDPSIQGTITRAIPSAATFKPVVFPSNTNFALPLFLFALAVVVGVYLLLHRTTIGYDIRALGTQTKAAVFGGVDAESTTILSMTLAGAVAGIGGAIYVMMVIGRWQTGTPPIGFDGIAVSVLAGNNPLGLVPSSLLFGILESGSQAIQFNLGIPRQLVGVLRGLIILLVATPELFRIVGRTLNRRDVIDLSGGGTEP
ncbi:MULTISPECIES: ABC transporter permease [Salinibaculum]|uniref:ABC transporter permease n=1 Tax=Salinibaculum TaxID=2732368 RepID=UPI0030CD80E6